MAPKDPSPSQATAAASLAPGFRFHPTDEELVSYYLKRKIGKKAFKVDAISELDLYKSEPWDLPEKSRIRSRDMEWYFFSPLDRKYANRSRTSRTTGVGYWKTTGKDRGVCRGGKTVGMKKTLVFHIGKAPKGTRTNWVMHEYRIVDEEISGRTQEAEYVVCRIFQKNGPGPQNGAQYGALFVEEEWEEEEEVEAEVEKKSGLVLTKEQPCDGSVVNFGDNLFMPQDGLLEHEQNNIPSADCYDSGQNPHNLFQNKENINKMAVNCTDIKSQGNDRKDAVSSTRIGDGLFEFNDDINFAEWMGIDGDADGDASDYLELTDFTNIIDADNSSTGHENLPLASQLEQPGTDEVFNTFGENASFTEPTHTQLPLTDDNLVFPNEMFGDPMMYFDASSDIPTFELDGSDPFASDMVDEFMTYFDSTEDSQFHFSPEGNKTDAQASEVPMPTTDIISDFKNENSSVTPEVSSDKSIINKHLESYLGSIPSPPALASEYPPNGLKSIKFSPSETHPSSSIRLATGTIRLDWSIHKNSVDHRSSLSYGKNDVFGKSQGIGGGVLSMLISSDFCVSLLSVLFLGITFKLGLCICKV